MGRPQRHAGAGGRQVQGVQLRRDQPRLIADGCGREGGAGGTGEGRVRRTGTDHATASAREAGAWAAVGGGMNKHNWRSAGPHIPPSHKGPHKGPHTQR